MRTCIRNTKSFPINRLISFLVFLFVCSASVAADFDMWVGETESYEMSGSGYYNFKLTRVDCAQTSVYTYYVGWVAKWTIKQYFSGTATVVIEYAYQVSRNSSWKNDRKTLTVSCKDNQVEIIPSSLMLVPREYKDLDYRFQNPSKVSGASLYWYTDDRSGKIITVSSGGRVTAKGPGTATVYLDHNQGSNQGKCVVTVKEVEPEKVYLDDISLTIDETKKLTPRVYPDGTSTTFTWWSDNEYIAWVDQSGYVTGKGVGTTSIGVKTANGITAKCNVTVTKPDFRVTSTTPAESATGVSISTPITITFSTQPQWAGGKSSSDVTLTNTSSGSKVAGYATLSGNRLEFIRQKALDPQTNYKLTIPAYTLEDKYGTTYTSEYVLYFKTGDREKLKLSISPEDVWVVEGTKATLTASISSAKIYYTTNGNTPTTSSTVYSSPITINNNITVKAFAQCEGFIDSDVLSKEYKLSTMKVSNISPKANESAGREVRPTITFNSKIQASEKLNTITLSKDGNLVRCDYIVYDNQLVCVPEAQLQGGDYTLSVPANAIKSDEGENNTPFSTTFSVAVPSAYSVEGQGNGIDFSALLKSDGSLWTWGYMNITATNDVLASVTPVKMADDVAAYALGGHHIAIVKTDHSLWMMGSNNYGQFGNGNVSGSSSFKKVMEGVKNVYADGSSSFIIKDDNTLWSCGENLYGTLGNGNENARSIPVKILDDVAFVSAKCGSGSCLAITLDGKMYVWGNYSPYGSRIPKYITDDVIYATVNGRGIYYIKKDNSLWHNKDIWVNGVGYYWEPYKVMDGVKKVLSNEVTTIILKTDGYLRGWGKNNCGMLGSEITSMEIEEGKSYPIMSGVVDFWANIDIYSGNCGAITQNHSVWTWGKSRNYYNDNYSGNTLGYDIANGIYPEPHEIVSSNGIRALSQLKLEKTYIKMIAGEKYALQPIMTPIDAAYDTPSWTSNKSEVAVVNSRGIVEAIKEGVAIISVTTAGKEATCIVNVTKIDPDTEATFIATTPSGVAMTMLVTDQNEKKAYVGDGTLAIDKNTSGVLVIPETLNGYAVTGISEKAFSGCDKLTAIVLPKTINTIGSRAFENCTGLQYLLLRSRNMVNVAGSDIALNYNAAATCPIYVHKSVIDGFKSDSEWKRYNLTPYLLGDANNDGRINLLDMNEVGYRILGVNTSRPFNIAAGDANEDNRINLLDMNAIGYSILLGTDLNK